VDDAHVVGSAAVFLKDIRLESNPGNARALVTAGADAVAVISDVFAHDDLRQVTDAAAAIAACFETRT